MTCSSAAEFTPMVGHGPHVRRGFGAAVAMVLIECLRVAHRRTSAVRRLKQQVLAEWLGKEVA